METDAHDDDFAWRILFVGEFRHMDREPRRAGAENLGVFQPKLVNDNGCGKRIVHASNAGTDKRFFFHGKDGIKN